MITYNFNNVEQAFGFNDVELSKIYGSGDYLLWEKGGGTVDLDIIEWESYKTQYFTMEFICNSYPHDVTFTTQGGWSVYYSLNNGEWVEIPAYTTQTVQIRNGDKMRIKSVHGTTNAVSPGWSIPSTTSYVKANIYGNIMSLFYGDNFINQTGQVWLGSMFGGGSGVISAKNLVLPSTSVSSYGYSGLFYNDTSLVEAPTILPATSIAEYGYNVMFENCTSLTYVPKELPAKTLTRACYGGMFRYCTAMTTSPKIKATTLGDISCGEMFKNCTNLNYVYCLATNGNEIINYNYPCTDWLVNTSATGTFVKKAGANWDRTMYTGIPVGWNVLEV